MADLPPDIMSMLSRGGNIPDEDEFEDFMDQVSSFCHHPPAGNRMIPSAASLLTAHVPHVVHQVNEVERLVKGMADGQVDAKTGDEKTQKLIEKQRQLDQARAMKKEADARAAAAAAKKKIEDDHRKKWGFYGMWCARCRAEKQIEAKTCDKCKSDLIDPDTRQKQLLARVEEVKAERIARDIARDRWKRWKVSALQRASLLLLHSFPPPPVRLPSNTSVTGTPPSTMAR
jgi:ribosomal protein L40E